MNKKTEFALIILTTILAACTAQAAPAPTEPTALPPTATAAAPTQPSATARPTALPTVTPTPLSPDAQALKDIVFSDCIPVEEGLPEGFEIPWNLLVMQDGDLYILNFAAGIKVKVPDFNERRIVDYYFHVSPDGKWLAYPGISGSKLIVEPAGTLMTNTDVDRIVWVREDWFYMERWVDNDTVLFIYQPPEDSWFFPTVLFNPFTREEQVFLLEEMPNYLEQHYGGAVIPTHYAFGGELVPDPTMRKLIYPERGDGRFFNTLWDVENERPLARLQFLLGYINDPLWSQDGNDVLLISPNQDNGVDWFLMTANGATRQVTQLGEVFQDQYYEIFTPSRSWDGRFLVFRLTYNEPDKTAKYIQLDLRTSPFEGNCIFSHGETTSFDGPVWSPDSKYFVISSTDGHDMGNIFMVDVENQAAYQIGQDTRVIGWIAKSEGEK